MSATKLWLQNEKELQIFVHESSRPVIQCLDSRKLNKFSVQLQVWSNSSNGANEISFDTRKYGKKGSFELMKDSKVVSFETMDFISFVFRLPCFSDAILQFSMVGIGDCSFASSMFENAYGHIKVPLRNKQNDVIGLVNFDYLVISPWENGVKQKIGEIDVPHWNPLNGQSDSRSLEIGHRGCGSTNGKTCSADTPIENTVASFELAYQKGADYIELDVHLSKDLNPVVFHDFHVAVKATQHFGGEGKLLIPINELSYEEMSSTKLLLSNDKLDKYGEDFMQEKMSLFPSLAKVLNDLPPELGIFVEVKFPMQDMMGTWEADYLPNKEKLVERILDVVYCDAKQRRIIFGSFDPDICTMLKLKQPNYPVVFITAGQNETWPLLMDMRCRNFEMAVGFAKGAGLMGISVYADALQQRMKDFLNYVADNGLELFTWGDVNMDSAFLSFQRNIGISGIIYDRLHQLK